MNIAVVGAGIFGVAAALELRDRAHAVTLFEQGRAPYARASSTDTSKTIRRLYGHNATYVDLVERAAIKWRDWAMRLGEPIYVRTGQLQIERDFHPGSRIHDSWEFMSTRDTTVEILSISDARVRFPQFLYHDGETCLYDPWGGYIASGDAVAGLVRLARESGIAVREDTPVTDVSEDSIGARVRADGRALHFDCVVVAAGVWIERLVPEVGRHIRPTRQEMAFFKPDDPGLLASGGMPVWAVNPETDGWYGHPLRRQGWVKVANDLRGDVVDPDAPRVVTPAFLDAARGFLAARIPALARAPLVDSRMCLYEETPDRHFIIDWAPGSRRILVAGGCSGHGFKFGGSIGDVIADALEHKDGRDGALFRIGRRFGSEPHDGVG